MRSDAGRQTARAVRRLQPFARKTRPVTHELTDRQLADIERSTQEIGRYLFDSSSHNQPSVWDRRWWNDRIMAWAMQDESVKVQMFRFVDVLPMLSTSEAVTRHLHEYFHDVRSQLPQAARLGLAVATPQSIAGRALAIAARRNAMGHARRFIAGTNQEEVLAAARRERKLRRAFTSTCSARPSPARAKPTAICRRISTWSRAFRRWSTPGKKCRRSIAPARSSCRA